MEIGLSLGSNMGDRLAQLSEAKRRLAAIPGISIVACSPVYETEPVGVPAEFGGLRFLNAVIIIETEQSLDALWGRLRATELDMGRNAAAVRNAPRPIDIDVIYAGELCGDCGGIVVPHPRWAERSFVVRPLNDVRPDMVVPGQTAAVGGILLSLPDSGKVLLSTANW